MAFQPTLRHLVWNGTQKLPQARPWTRKVQWHFSPPFGVWIGAGPGSMFFRPEKSSGISAHPSEFGAKRVPEARSWTRKVQWHFSPPFGIWSGAGPRGTFLDPKSPVAFQPTLRSLDWSGSRKHVLGPVKFSGISAHPSAFGSEPVPDARSRLPLASCYIHDLARFSCPD